MIVSISKARELSLALDVWGMRALDISRRVTRRVTESSVRLFFARCVPCL